MKTLAIVLASLIGFHSPFASPTAHAASSSIPLSSFESRPKLVLALVIDQFRADYLTRFKDRFLPAQGAGGDVGGFRYLMQQGAYFPFAEYDVLQNITCSGHAMILSGSYPYQNGIIMNHWLDPVTRKPTYCVDDATSPIVGVKNEDGRSPRNFRGTTVGDELKNAGFPSRVVSISMKDRSAIMLGGYRADLALWLDRGDYRWVSSEFYLPEKKLPGWVDSLNQQIEKKKGEPYVWEPRGTATGLTGDKPVRYAEKFGKKSALNLPLSVELTVEAAEKAIEAYRLGDGKATDLLAVSLSAHDYLGHLHGPNSREMEEMTIEEDRLISRLLNSVRKKLPGGLKDVVITLTADHGIIPTPATLKAGRIPTGELNGEEVTRELEDKLTRKFGKPEGGKWIAGQGEGHFYFVPQAIASRAKEASRIESEAKAVLSKNSAVAHVFTRTEYRERKLPPELFEKQVLRSYVPGRSGDVVAIFKPFHSSVAAAVNHMTGYSYDRTVPLIIAGPQIKSGVYPGRAGVVDLAPTLSFMLGIIPPALSEGRVLSEIF